MYINHWQQRHGGYRPGTLLIMSVSALMFFKLGHCEEDEHMRKVIQRGFEDIMLSFQEGIWDWRGWLVAAAAGCTIAVLCGFEMSRWHRNRTASDQKDKSCQTYDAPFSVCLRCCKLQEAEGSLFLDHLDKLEETVEECATLQLKDFHLSIPEGALTETPLTVTLTLGNISKYYQMLHDECLIDGIKLAPYSLILKPHGQFFYKSYQVTLDTPLAWLLGYPILLHRSDPRGQWEDKTEDFQLQSVDGRLLYQGDQFSEHFLAVITGASLGVDTCRAFLLDCFNGYKNKILFRLQFCEYLSEASPRQFRFLLLCSTELESGVVLCGKDLVSEPCGRPAGEAWSKWSLTDGTPLVIYTNQWQCVLTFTLNLVMCKQGGLVMLFDCCTAPGNTPPLIDIKMKDPFTGKEISVAEIKPDMGNIDMMAST